MENPESWKFLLVECGILGLEIRSTAVGIRNPSPTGKDLESSNWNAESTAWTPESKTWIPLHGATYCICFQWNPALRTPRLNNHTRI